MPKETADILQKARDLITPPEAWTQGWLAKTASGQDVGFDDQNAVCFCAYGAVYRAVGLKSSYRLYNDIEASPEVVKIRNLLLVAVRGSFPSDVAEFNDTHSHAEVLAAFDRAIAAARED